MPQWSSDDAHRSIRDWLGMALGSPPWQVWTERRDMDAALRNVAVVEQAAPRTLTTFRTSIPQGNVEWAQTFSIMCYPSSGETPQEARLAAQLVADRLGRVVAHGLVDDAGEESIAPPLRIPLRDYEGVPAVGADREADPVPYDWLLIEDPGALRIVQDPVDHMLFTVPLDLRVSWEAPGRDVPPAPVAVGMPGAFDQP
jgi:hypothetical protein